MWYRACMWCWVSSRFRRAPCCAGTATNWAPPNAAEAARTGADVYDVITGAATAGPSPVFVLPHFAGTGTPALDPEAKGAFVGITLSTTRGDMIKGILDSLTYEMKLNLDLLAESGVPVTALRAIGGGARSARWLQLKSDILGVPIETPDVLEAGCLGAAILAGAAAGVYNSPAEGAGACIRIRPARTRPWRNGPLPGEVRPVQGIVSTLEGTVAPVVAHYVVVHSTSLQVGGTRVNFTVMTFNLRTNVAADGDNAWPNRVEAAAKVLRESGALLVGIQEGLHGMVTDLASQLPEYGWFGQGSEGGTADEHCAIFYKRDQIGIVEQGDFWLSETPDRPGTRSWNSACPRMCTWARVRVSNGQEILIYNTHLDHKSQEAREKGIALVWQALNAKHRETGLPALVMGDLNATPDNAVVRFLRGQQPLAGQVAHLKDAYEAVAGEPAATFHMFTGKPLTAGPIDYIFGTPDVAFQATVVDQRTIEGRYPSIITLSQPWSKASAGIDSWGGFL